MSVALAANALLTLDEYYDISGIDQDNDYVKEHQIKFLINTVSQEAKAYCNRELISPGTAQPEIFDGTGNYLYYVKQGRIKSTVGNITLHYLNDGTWTLLSATTYPLEIDPYEYRYVYFKKYNYSFTKGLRNWKITYDYGWAVGDIPADLKMSIVQLMNIRSLDMKKRADLLSESFGDSTTSYDRAEGVPQIIRGVWDRYRLTELRL